jgi:hypothetical protein
MTLKKSEQLLEIWCSQSGWLCERILEDSARTPDYRITIAGTQLYAEVKEIIANEEERNVIEQLSTRGWSGPFGEEPGKTIREKIKESYGQIKRFTEVENCSGVLVLYNNSGMVGLGRLDHYHVLTGMFGLQTVPISIPRDPQRQPIYGPDYFGPKKSVTANRNRYLSAIITLYEHHKNGLTVYCYHNPHAIHPIHPALINVTNCVQYKFSSVKLNWELVQFHLSQQLAYTPRVGD